MNIIKTTGDNDCTSYPWWGIVSPRRGLVRKDEAVAHFAGAITGPFFSRKSAQDHLDARRYRYPDNAAVWCFSGHESWDYREAVDNGKAQP